MGETFQLIVMGCTGGPREGNLSGYLFSPLHKQEWIALDGGSLMMGIEKGLEKKSFEGVPFTDPTLIPAAEFIRNHLKAFLISHSHLDHIAGLVLNSQIDIAKSILGIDSTLDNMRDYVFNGLIWPNYGDEGNEPRLNKYRYVRLPLHKMVSIPETEMKVEAFLLSHPHGYPSSAFLIERGGDYVLYFGDTSSDTLEVEKHLERIWRRVAPLIQAGRVKAILLECSFSHREENQVLFGHLDTKLMMHELHQLASIANVSLKGLKVIVTHRKESMKKGEDAMGVIAKELAELNDLGIALIFPQQGDRIVV